MARWHKVGEMAGLSFENGLRLHFDSIEMYETQSYASAYQLSILAAEELGKALMLEEYIFRVAIEKSWDKERKDRFLMGALTNHGVKQRWFAGSASTFLRRHRSRMASSVITLIFDGISEKEKQDSTYLGLTRHRNGKINIDGKIVVPRLLAQPDKVKKHITLVNDYLLVYAEGYSRNVYATDTPYVGDLLTQGLVEMLGDAWGIVGQNARAILKELREHEVTKNTWSWFERAEDE